MSTELRPYEESLLLELKQTCPRPVPGRLREGSYNQGFKNWALGFGAASLLLAILRVSPLFEDAAWYFPVLALAGWIAFAFSVLSMLLLWRSRRTGKPHEFYVWGEAHLGTVENVSLVSTLESSGQVTHTAFAVRTRLDDHRHFDFQSNSFELGKFTTTLKPGDRVTVLERPTGCCLYGFLRIDPKLDYLQRSELSVKKGKQEAMTAAVLLIAVVGATVAANLYQLLDVWSNLTVAAILLAFVPAIPLGRRFARESLECAKRERATQIKIKTGEAPRGDIEFSKFEKFGNEIFNPLMMVFGAWCLCWASIFSVLVFVNGYCDKSPREEIAVNFERIDFETSDLIAAFHVVYYERNGKREVYNLKHYEAFDLEIESMSILVRRGFLGARWIDGCSFFYPGDERQELGG